MALAVTGGGCGPVESTEDTPEEPFTPSVEALSMPAGCEECVIAAVRGTSDNDVYFAGYQKSVGGAVMLRWDGQSLVEVALPDNRPQLLGNISASGPNDVWALPALTSDLTPGPDVVHWDGNTWTSMDVVAEQVDSVMELSLAAIAPGDAWLFVAAGAVAAYHWDGVSWTERPEVPLTPGAYHVTSWAGAPDDIWVAYDDVDGDGNYAPSQAVVLHFDGSEWSVVMKDEGFSLRGLFGTDTGEPLLATWNGVYTWKNGAFEPLSADETDGCVEGALGDRTRISARSLHDIWAMQSDARGEVSADTYVAHWDGTAWECAMMTREDNFAGLWMGPEQGWLAGSTVARLSAEK